jgi:hypothetical protein
MLDRKFRKKYLVLCYNYVFFYIKGRALQENTSINITKFLKEEVFI